MSWHTPKARPLPTAAQFSNRGSGAVANVDGKPSSGSPRGVPAMKAGNLGGFTSRSRVGVSSTNPGGAGNASGRGGLGSSKGS